MPNMPYMLIINMLYLWYYILATGSFQAIEALNGFCKKGIAVFDGRGMAAVMLLKFGSMWGVDVV